MTALALLILAALSAAAAEPISVTWEQTPGLLASRDAIVDLDSGTRLYGRWLAVTPSAFSFDVTYSTGRNPVPPGACSFDRASLRRLRFREKRIRARSIGTAAGYFTGAGVAAQNFNRSRDYGKGFAVIVATTTTGYLVGRIFDKRTYEVRLTD